MKKLVSWIVALGLVAAPFAAHAEGNYTRSGAYVGINGTYALENFDLGSDVSASGSPGVSVYAGYRLHANFALQGDVDYYKAFDVDLSGSKVGNVDAFSWMVNAKGFILEGRVQPYGVVGIGGLYTNQIDGVYCISTPAHSHCDAGNVSRVSAIFRPGLGVDFYLTPEIVLNLQGAYTIPTGSQSDYQFGLLGAGVQYRF